MSPDTQMHIFLQDAYLLLLCLSSGIHLLGPISESDCSLLDPNKCSVSVDAALHPCQCSDLPAIFVFPLQSIHGGISS